MREIAGSRSNNPTILDLVAVASRSWVLLVSGALLAGGCAFVIALLQPEYFESRATLAFNAQVAQKLVTSTEIINPVIEELYPEASATELNLARRDLKSQLSFSSQPIDTTQISLVRKRQDEVQDILAALLNRLSESTALETPYRRLQKRRDIELDAIKSLNLARTALNFERRSGVPNETFLQPEGFARAINVLTTSIVTHHATAAKFERRMHSLPKELVVEGASIAISVSTHKRIVVVVLTALTTGFILLIFVCARDGVYWANTAAKTAHIKRGTKARNKKMPSSRFAHYGASRTKSKR